MKTAQRKAPGKLWSATSSIQWLDDRGATLARTPRADSMPRGAIKAKVHYRVGSVSKKPTFAGADLAAQVDGFQALLVAAYHGDWDADDKGRPVPPRPLPTAGPGNAQSASHQTREDPAATPAAPLAQVLPFGPGAAQQGVPVGSGPVALPSTGPADDCDDVAGLVRWYAGQFKTGTKKRGGRKRSPNTVDQYNTHLRFFLDHAVYQAGDPRLETLGVEPGTPMRLKDAEKGITERDLILMLELRASSNRRTRSANERAMAAWAGACVRAEEEAVRIGVPPVIPPPPELVPETASARTIEAFAQQVKATFTAAHLRGKISYQPWTISVDDEVTHAPATHYTTRLLPNREQVAHAATTMASYWRRSTTAEGYPVSLNGGRYQAMVWLAGRKGTRPEETIAIRDSWVKLDDDDPRVELQWAEVYHPRPGGGRDRAHVPLKHRDPGVVRVIRPAEEDREEFVRVLSEHRRLHVADPDPASPDPERRDPYFFTTHRGAPVDLSNFSDDWWKPAMALAFPDPATAHLVILPFRRLRAAAITDWLVVLGYTTQEAADEAGNTQAVIERHYKGVIDALPPRRRRRPNVPTSAEALIEGLEHLDDDELAAVLLAARKRAQRALADQ